MKKWLIVLGVVFLIEVIAETAHLMSQYVFFQEVSRTSIVAFVALLLSVAMMVDKK